MALLANRLAYLRAFVAEPVKQPGLALGEQIWGDRRTRFCYFTAIAFSLCFSLLFYQQAFSAPFVIQDDARQHIFWMRRFLDPELFPNDLIADYFESVAPAGYSLLYRIAALLGFDPILFSKLLPLGLSLIAVSYCFGLSLTIFPLPVAAFSSALLLAQSLCFTDTLVSGIQKAFIYPFVCAFLYYLAQRRWLGTVISLVLLGGFYPQMVLIAAGTLALQLLVWQRQKWGWRLGWTGDRQTWRISLLGLGTAFAVLLPYALGDSGYGPVVSADQARQMPEFFKGGRARYFRDDNPGEYWFGGRSGLRFNSALTPATNALGLVLPLLLRLDRAFPLARQLQASGGVLVRFLLASGMMFLAAHALLFRLHLPSRYSGHSLRLSLSLGAGIALVILLDGILAWSLARVPPGSRPWRLGSKSGSKSGSKPWFKPWFKPWTGGLSALGLSALLLLYPLTVAEFPLYVYSWADPNSTDLYRFFQSQPKDSLIASLSWEADNFPTMSQRSVLVGLEYAVPYHLGYYQRFRERMLALIEAQYSPDPAVVQAFIQRYGIDFWFLDLEAFWPEYLEKRGLEQFEPAIAQAQRHLDARDAWLWRAEQRGMAAPCIVFEHQGSRVLDSRCLLQVLEGGRDLGDG